MHTGPSETDAPVLGGGVHGCVSIEAEPRPSQRQPEPAPQTAVDALDRRREHPGQRFAGVAAVHRRIGHDDDDGGGDDDDAAAERHAERQRIRQ